MAIRIRLTAVILFLFSCCLLAGAQVVHRIDTLSVTIYFQKQSCSYDPLFRNNNSRLQAFIESMERINAGTVISFSGIVGASVNGIAFDERFLCERRISSLSPVLAKKLPAYSDSLKLENVGQNWKRLERCVAENKDIMHRDEALEIIRNPMNRYFKGDTLADTRIFQMMKLDRGQVWPELEKRFSQEMDAAEIICVFRNGEFLPPQDRALESSRDSSVVHRKKKKKNR